MLMADEPSINNNQLDYININDESIEVAKPSQLVAYQKQEYQRQ